MTKFSIKIKVVALILSVLTLTLAGCGGPVHPQKMPADTNLGKPAIDGYPDQDKYSSETRLSFVGVGDNIIHEAVFTDAANRASVYASSTGESSRYRFVDMYEGIADLIAEADISYVNHETPIAGDSFGIKGYPDFNAPDEAGDTLIDLGFDIINMANNHMLDMGEAGLRETIKYWNGKSGDFVMIGGYTKSDYDQVRIIERQGVKIALLSYTTFVNDKHKNSLSSGSELLVPYADDATIRRQTALAHDSGADVLIAAIHWGVENAFAPNAQQKRLAKLLADCGVDVVLGSHSHTLQPVEWVEGASGNKTLVAYSLGNLINTMHYSYYMVGGALTFDIVKEKDGEAKIENPVLVPTMCHYSMTRDTLQMYLLQDYTEELLRAHGSQLKGAFTMQTLHGYVKDNISPEFLPEFFK
ncbi:MAG: CapA family protein [Clostridia bacterium]|nr:CapA family protein [Clostridia bacterium]